MIGAVIMGAGVIMVTRLHNAKLLFLMPGA